MNSTTLDTATLRASLEDPARVRPVELHHVNFKTRDIDGLAAWYCLLLNAEVLFNNGLAAFLTYDRATHRIALLGNPDLEDADPGALGFEHVAFRYATLADLVATWERLRDRGHEPFWTTNHGPSISYYYRDPDGNTNELQVDWFADLEQLADWFVTGDFDENPIGVDVDPEKLCDTVRAGEDHHDIFRRSRAGEFY